MHITSIVQSYSYIRTTQRCFRDYMYLKGSPDQAGSCKNEFLLSELGVKSLVVFKSPLNTQVFVGLTDVFLSSIFHLVQLVR